MGQRGSKYEFYFNLLDQGVPAWNTWRKDHPDKIIDLSGANLNYLDLSKVNFSKVNLDNARFQGTNFRDADFQLSSLRFVNIYRCTLDGANFYGVKSSFVTIVDTSLATVQGKEFLNGALCRTSRSSML
ncbi:MAG: pentapeptide repeat-containing protein [Candidatus Magasanikbacteria bacterium]|nr:pentapeptide repeat-containing protein [Candidatus Magasanikbacteria bacterium]MCA9391289.1 pentapeptide repeat-containing protein [Candidatus Magasanikbacteria bacterium]USN52998.1 MAG: pentapeptide repeat-containing protein [Candidatus Nomurabacteria bacterium]HPF95126.1 pentapeptide repeat-containing protein [bacterium]